MPCTHAASTRQVLTPSVQNGKEMAPSSCLYTQVSSKPSRVKAICSTSAPRLYHTWKHAVPAARGPKLVPCHAPVCSAVFTPLCLCHPIYLHRAEPFSSCSGEQGVLEAAMHPLSCCSYQLCPWPSRHQSRAELPGSSQQSSGKGMNGRNDTNTGVLDP